MRLNLGCGKDIRDGYFNCDKLELPGVDRVMDLEHLPLPFLDESVDEILLHHVLEHLSVDLVQLMAEFNRILKPGGKLRIWVPNHNCLSAWGDPTHRRCFNFLTFRYFVRGHPMAFYSDTNRLFSSLTVREVPATAGKLFPRFVLHYLSYFIGQLIAELDVELVK